MTKGNQLFLVDFGLAEKYQTKLKKSSFEGTPNFGSITALEGRGHYRKDDLEAFGYLLAYLEKGKLPWQISTEGQKQLSAKELAKQKKRFPLNQLCSGEFYLIT